MNINRDTFIIYKYVIYLMGYLTNLVNKNSNNKYDELTDADLINPVSENQISFVNIKNQEDIINTKEALHDGQIIIADVAVIESNGLSLEVVYGEIQSAVNAVGGDIVHKQNNDIIVAVPRNTEINRNKL